MDGPTRSPSYDIFLIGVGGQGVLTVGDLIAETALRSGLPVNVYPTKGMAQRGGSVRVQVRIGPEVVGPQIPERGADLAIAMERSEALKAVRYVKPGADFVLYGDVWEPTRAMLGRADYPALEQVRQRIRQGGAVLSYLRPADRPEHDGRPVAANIFVLGAAMGLTALSNLLDSDLMADVVASRWERYADANRAAFRAGLHGGIHGS